MAFEKGMFQSVSLGFRLPGGVCEWDAGASLESRAQINFGDELMKHMYLNQLGYAHLY